MVVQCSLSDGSLEAVRSAVESRWGCTDAGIGDATVSSAVQRSAVELCLQEYPKDALE